MTTIVNSPAPASDSSMGGFLMGVIILVIIAVIVWFYGVPLIKKDTTQINVPAPQINVPSQIDVNVNQAE